MIKTFVFIGFLTGLSANVAGILLYIFIFTNGTVDEALRDAVSNGYLSKIIVLGAVFNFLPFFVFLKKNQIYHARGVLLATVVTAVIIAVLKIIE